jgi:hypothetical protein
MSKLNTKDFKRKLKAVASINKEAIQLERREGGWIVAEVQGSHTTARFVEHIMHDDREGDLWICTVETKALLDLVCAATGDTFDLRPGEGETLLVDGVGIPTMISNGKYDFEIEDRVEREYFPEDYLRAVVKTCAKFVTKEGSAYSTDGIMMYENGTAIATDCHRLAQYGIEKGEHGRIVRVETLKVASNLLKGGQLKVEIGDGRIRFTQGDDVVVGNCIDGEFPAWWLITKDIDRNATGIDLATLELRSAVEKAVVLTKGDEDPIMELLLQDEVEVSAGGYEIQKVAYEGDVPVCGPVFALNPVYLLDMLKIVGKSKDSLRFEFRTPEDGVRFGGFYTVMTYVET